MKQRILSLVLCLSLLFSLLPMNTLAAEDGMPAGANDEEIISPASPQAEENTAGASKPVSETAAYAAEGGEGGENDENGAGDEADEVDLSLAVTLSTSGKGIDSYSGGYAALLKLSVPEGTTAAQLPALAAEAFGITEDLSGRTIYINGTKAEADTAVTNGAHVELCKLEGSEVYVAFAARKRTAAAGEELIITLTGSSVGNCAITANGNELGKTADDGTLAITFAEAGTYVLSAYKLVRRGQQVIQAINAPVCVVTVTAPAADFATLELFAGSESLITFTPDQTGYTLPEGTDRSMDLTLRYTGLNPGDTASLVQDGRTTSLTADTAETLSFFGAGRKNFTLRAESAAGGSSKNYTFTWDVLPTLSSLNFSAGGALLSLDKAFNGTQFTYTLTIPEDCTSVTYTAKAYSTGSTLSCNGSSGTEISLGEQEDLQLLVTSADGRCSSTYSFHLNRAASSSYRVSVQPEEAVVKLYDAAGTALEPQADGTYAGILNPADYTYTATCYGYVGQTGTLPAGGRLTLELKPVPEGSAKQDVGAAWKNFRNADNNMAITSAALPVESAEATLLWTKLLGKAGDWSSAPSVQIIVDNALIVMSGTTINKLNLSTGETIASGTLCAAPNWGYTPPTYAEGMIFCPLAGGTIQAVDAKTLQSLWIYKDPKGGQSLTPITYSSGYIYTGFWTGENSVANFVCLSVSDEDPTRGDEQKLATWRRANLGGYYWSGCAVIGDAVVLGTATTSAGNANLWSLNRLTGSLISEISLPGSGNVRSSVAYSGSNVYFTSQGGYLYSAAIGADGTLSGLKKVSIGSQSTSTPVVYNGMAYVGVGSGITSSGSTGSFVVVDLSAMQVKTTVALKGYPQCSMLLSTAYESEGYLDFYSTYNAKPGGLTAIRVKLADYSAEINEIYDADGHEEYCITSLVCSSDGTLYYKNDSCYVFAVGLSGAPVVENLIRSLPEPVTIESRAAIQNARAAYDNLTDAQKEQVSNYADLEKAEAALEPILKRVNDVAEAIRAIGTIDGSAAAETRFQTAKKLYEALSGAEQSSMDEAVRKLYTDAAWQQERYDNARAVEKLISAIGTVTNTTACKNRITAARKAFDALLSAEKTIVINEKYYSILTTAESRLKSLQSSSSGSTKKATDSSAATPAVDEAAKELIELIDELLDADEPSEEDILRAAQRYSELDAERKAQVSNYSDLQDFCEMLAEDYHAAGDAYAEDLPWYIRMEWEELHVAPRSGYQALRGFSLRFVNVLTGMETETVPFTLYFDAPEGCEEYEGLRMLHAANGREDYADCDYDGVQVSFICQGSGQWILLGELGESTLELPEDDWYDDDWEEDEPGEAGFRFMPVIIILGLLGFLLLAVLLVLKKKGTAE